MGQTAGDDVNRGIAASDRLVAEEPWSACPKSRGSPGGVHACPARPLPAGAGHRVWQQAGTGYAKASSARRP